MPFIWTILNDFKLELLSDPETNTCACLHGDPSFIFGKAAIKRGIYFFSKKNAPTSTSMMMMTFLIAIGIIMLLMH